MSVTKIEWTKGNRDPLEIQANAKLISAVPQLLQALEILHPKWSVWRTPTEEQAAFIEQAMKKAGWRKP